MKKYRRNFLKENLPIRGWYTCAHCGKKIRLKDMQVDHIVPQNYGGWDSADNLQPLCPVCNGRKRDSLSRTLPDYFLNNIRRARKKFLGD